MASGHNNIKIKSISSQTLWSGQCRLGFADSIYYIIHKQQEHLKAHADQKMKAETCIDNYITSDNYNTNTTKTHYIMRVA